MIAYVYWMFSTSMPRTGGDYIWTSRVLGPFVGFLESSMILFVMITSFVSYDIYLAVTNGFSYVFINFGFLTNNQGLMNTGESLITDKLLILVVTLAITALVIAVMMLPIKRIVSVLVACFVGTTAIFVLYMALLVHAGNSGFSSSFNELAKNSSAYTAVANSTTAMLPTRFREPCSSG